MNKERKQLEKEQHAVEERNEAAEALLLLARTAMRKAQRDEEKKRKKPVPLRRSKRIYENEQREHNKTLNSKNAKKPTKKKLRLTETERLRGLNVKQARELRNLL